MAPLEADTATSSTTVAGLNTSNGESVLGFSSNLISTLMASRAKLDAFVEAQKARADAACNAHADAVSAEQREVDSLVSDLNAVQFERGVGSSEDGGGGSSEDGGIARRRNRLRDRHVSLETDIADLNDQIKKEKLELDEVSKEEGIQRKKAEEAWEAKREVEEAKKATVEDLTKGLVNYKKLGLDFLKAGGSAMRFKFTQLDPKDPSRQFSFTLDVNDDDEYEVEECDPPIGVANLVDSLNEGSESDFSKFVRGMRKAFEESL